MLFKLYFILVLAYINFKISWTRKPMILICGTAWNPNMQHPKCKNFKVEELLLTIVQWILSIKLKELGLLMDTHWYLDFMEEVVHHHKLTINNIIIIKIYISINYLMVAYGLHQDHVKMIGICGLKIIWMILYFKLLEHFL